MTYALFTQAVLSAFSVGFGCGTCCIPQTGTFLSSYIISHGKGVRTYLCFFLGKSTAVILLCLVSSLLGVQLVNESGFIGNINIHALLQIVLIILGVVLILRWRNRYYGKRDCENCSSCASPKTQTDAKKHNGLSLFFIGFSCGVTPCAPMFFLMGQSALLPWTAAVFMGGAFALTSSLSPVLLMVILSGVLSVKMKAQIPRWIKWFQLGSYAALIAVSTVFLVTRLT
jgi:hypothetical protein